MTTADNLASLLTRSDEIKQSLVSLISDIDAASQFLLANPDYDALQRLISELQSQELQILIDHQARLISTLDQLKTASQISTDQQIQTSKSLEELEQLYLALIQFFRELSQRSEATFANASSKLQQSLANQQSVETYQQYLNSLKQLYKGILGIEPVAALSIQFPVVSRFNDQYFCNVTYAHRDAQYVKLSFDVHGDMSLGELQDPLASKIFCNGLVFSVADHAYEVQDAKSAYSGTLVFAVSDLPNEPILFAYGSSGYSSVTIA